MLYFIFIFTLLLDQTTKLWAVNSLPLHEFVPVFPFFNLFLTFNKGVSFSLFSGYSVLFLIALSLALCAAILYWLHKETDGPTKAALVLILGGAVGNVIDRVRLGAVIDFLDVYYQTYHWPAFNIADSAICIGAGLIVLRAFLIKKEKENV